MKNANEPAFPKLTKGEMLSAIIMHGNICATGEMMMSFDAPRHAKTACNVAETLLAEWEKRGGDDAAVTMHARPNSLASIRRSHQRELAKMCQRLAKEHGYLTPAPLSFQFANPNIIINLNPFTTNARYPGSNIQFLWDNLQNECQKFTPGNWEKEIKKLYFSKIKRQEITEEKNKTIPSWPEIVDKYMEWPPHDLVAQLVALKKVINASRAEHEAHHAECPELDLRDCEVCSSIAAYDKLFANG